MKQRLGGATTIYHLIAAAGANWRLANASARPTGHHACGRIGSAVDDGPESNVRLTLSEDRRTQSRISAIATRLKGPGILGNDSYEGSRGEIAIRAIDKIRPVVPAVAIVIRVGNIVGLTINRLRIGGVGIGIRLSTQICGRVRGNRVTGGRGGSIKVSKGSFLSGEKFLPGRERSLAICEPLFLRRITFGPESLIDATIDFRVAFRFRFVSGAGSKR